MWRRERVPWDTDIHFDNFILLKYFKLLENNIIKECYVIFLLSNITECGRKDWKLKLLPHDFIFVLTLRGENERE
jgi:hypothetical protein